MPLNLISVLGSTFCNLISKEYLAVEWGSHYRHLKIVYTGRGWQGYAIIYVLTTSSWIRGEIIWMSCKQCRSEKFPYLHPWNDNVSYSDDRLSYKKTRHLIHLLKTRETKIPVAESLWRNLPALYIWSWAPFLLARVCGTLWESFFYLQIKSNFNKNIKINWSYS